MSMLVVGVTITDLPSRTRGVKRTQVLLGPTLREVADQATKLWSVAVAVAAPSASGSHGEHNANTPCHSRAQSGTVSRRFIRRRLTGGGLDAVGMT